MRWMQSLRGVDDASVAVCGLVGAGWLVVGCGWRWMEVDGEWREGGWEGGCRVAG